MGAARRNHRTDAIVLSYFVQARGKQLFDLHKL